MADVDERVSELEYAIRKLVYAQFNTEMELQQLSKEMKVFKDEMKDFKDEMSEFKDEMKDFKDEMKDFKLTADKLAIENNKRWGEIANKLGTVVEDIVAPNIPSVAREYFGCAELEYFGIHVTKRQPGDKSKRREFDVIAIADDKVLVNETKETVRDSYLKDYVEFVRLGEFYRYFPEYNDKQLVPIFSSLNVANDKIQ